MTNEERARWIGRAFWIVLLGAIAGGVWLYSKPEQEAVATDEVLPAIEDALDIAHHHLPGDPDSERMAGILARIQQQYGPLIVLMQVIATETPAAPAPGLAAGQIAEEAAAVSHVVMSANDKILFEIHGPMPEADVQRKVDELLASLRRFGKGWRPAVPGMRPARS